jgi:hypothetical protein
MVTTAHGHPEANLEVFTTSGQINFKFNPLGYTMENLMGYKPGSHLLSLPLGRLYS